MEWLRWLGDLSPTALLVIAIWIIAKHIIIPMLRSHRETVERMAESHQKEAEALAASLDENTEAVKMAIEHNETIIRNHLSRQEKTWEAVKEELINVRDSVNTMNNRRRLIDGKRRSGLDSRR